MKRQRRTGPTETFSVSVDRETKRMLKAAADRDYHGNVSALVTAMAREADRRAAAGELLQWFGVAPMSAEEAETFQAGLAQEIRVANKPKRRRRRAA